MVTLCLSCGCQEQPAQNKKEEYSFLSKNNSNPVPRLELSRKVEREKARQLLKALQDEFDPQKRGTGSLMLYTRIFSDIVVIVVLGWLYWNTNWQKFVK